MQTSLPKPSEWEALFRWAESLTGLTIPPVLQYLLGLLIFLFVFVVVGAAIVLAIAQIKDAWVSHLRPKTYSPEERQKVVARKQFAQYLQDEISRRDRSENWRDQQFTELEAEVEAEGSRRSLWGFGRRPSGIRKEKSLSKALERSAERLILVEGEPG